jgi:nucleotide-binding universal stress UspA family protein
MKILVPVDGSTHSVEALRAATDFAKMGSAEIYVISVAPFIGGMEDHEISPSRRERYIESVGKRANDIVKEACAVLDAEKVVCTSAEAITTIVSVHDEIIEFAEKEKIDLIIMGSKGLSQSSRFKLGSVASQVVKYSPCSVYVVKTPPSIGA